MCVYIYIYTHIFVYSYVYIHTYIHIHTYIYYTHIYIFTYIHTCIYYTQIYIHINLFIFVCTNLHESLGGRGQESADAPKQYPGMGGRLL